MASKLKKTKKARKPKTSKGIHGGGGKVTLTAIQLVSMGKGLYVGAEKRTAKEK